MKRTYSILIVALLLVSTNACKKEFLNVQPLDKFADAAVWSDPALIQTFVNNIYLGIPHGFSNIMMASMVDETTYNADFGSSNVTKSLITPSDYSIFDENYWTGNRQRGLNWRNVYRFVRGANVFFDNIDKSPIESAEVRDRLKGEVHFLRAYLYNNLVSMYGGVPIITKAYTLTDSFNVPRNSYEECINFITSECDKAAAFLPASWSGNDKGRATKGAALALKSRVLLTAASDLYNSNGSWAGSYPNKELIGYVGGSQQTRWQAAKDAAKAVIDLNAYSLFKESPASTAEASKNYGDIFLSRETSEDIFVRYFTPKIDEGWDGYHPGLYNTPNGWHGWGSNTPIGQMVDSYEMNDGSKFDWNNPAHKAEPYKNRDPRFYASINYEGAIWRQRPSDVAAKDPIGVVQVGYYEKPNGDLVPGLDTRNSPIEDWNGTYTGYYLRKFIDPTKNAQFEKQDLPWRYIRYTEIILNYVEASLHLGQELEAKTYLNMIRKRAGMPDITETGQALIDRFRNERRVELAFEDHRYVDVRRWMIAPQAYEDAKGVSVRYKLNADGSILSGPTYSVIVAQDRDWNPRFYFFPIKLDEMNRNDKLIQNPLY